MRYTLLGCGTVQGKVSFLFEILVTAFCKMQVRSSFLKMNQVLSLCCQNVAAYDRKMMVIPTVFLSAKHGFWIC
jgi:hypothetical protein